MREKGARRISMTDITFGRPLWELAVVMAVAAIAIMIFVVIYDRVMTDKAKCERDPECEPPKEAWMR